MVVATLYSTGTSTRHACCCCSSIQWMIQTCTGVLGITMLFNLVMGALLHGHGCLWTHMHPPGDATAGLTIDALYLTPFLIQHTSLHVPLK